MLALLAARPLREKNFIAMELGQYLILLSGVLVCGCCGADYTFMVKDRYGCAERRSKGTCTNDRTISRREIEERILRALKQNLLTPELVAEFTRAYQKEVNRLMKDATSKAAEVESKLAAVQRKADGILRAIEDGLYQPLYEGALSRTGGGEGSARCLSQRRADRT